MWSYVCWEESVSIIGPSRKLITSHWVIWEEFDSRLFIKVGLGVEKLQGRCIILILEGQEKEHSRLGDRQSSKQRASCQQQGGRELRV